MKHCDNKTTKTKASSNIIQTGNTDFFALYQTFNCIVLTDFICAFLTVTHLSKTFSATVGYKILEA